MSAPAKIHSFSVLAVVTILFSVMSIGATDIPSHPRKAGQSLLGIIARVPEPGGEARYQGTLKAVIEGPERLVLPLKGKQREMNIFWFAVEPGLYTASRAGDLIAAPGVRGEIEVPPSVIILAPFSLVRTSTGVKIHTLDESERQWAGRELSNQTAYTEWEERDLIGFGVLRPSVEPENIRHKVTFNSDSPGAEVFVDDVLAGLTPLSFSMTAGKYRVLVRLPGYQDSVHYIRLLGDAVIGAELIPSLMAAETDGPELYMTLIAPFRSLGAPDQQLSMLFAETLALALKGDSRLDIVPSPVNWVQRGSVEQPDYVLLEDTGADLAVSGFFGEAKGQITIQANLYDVRAETIRAAVTWHGSAGVDIFDALDSVALEFAAEVDRVLPDAGRVLVVRRETVYGSDEDAQFTRKKIVQNRWNEHPNLLDFRTGFGGNLEKYQLEDSGLFTTAQIFDGPAIPVSLNWDHDIGPYFALGSGITVNLGPQRTDETSNSKTLGWTVAVSGGPRLVFRSHRSDIVLGIDAQLMFSPGFTYSWFDGVPLEDDVSSFLFINFPIRAGFRYYFNKRTDTMPTFLSGGLAVSPGGFRFDVSGGDQKGLAGTTVMIEIGMGIRL